MKNDKPTKQIVVNDGELTLTLQATNEPFLRKLLIDLGDPEVLIKPDVLVGMHTRDRMTTVHAADRYLDYVLGFGVVDDPPADLDFGELLFVMSNEQRENIKNQYMRRAYWLRYAINDFQGLSLSDQSDIVAEVTALTLGVAPIDVNEAKNGRVRSKRSAKRK